MIYAAGFAETGNSDLQQQLLEAANGMPLMGPNCYGFVNTLSRAALWPDETGLEPVERGVALITQSGNIACNFTMMMRGLPVAAVFSIGNQVDVGMHDMVETLSADKRISAIGLHVEGLPDVAAFARAAALARQRKVPIVVLKTGRSEQGAKVAMSHTSSLAGADTLYDALFERYGVARMKSVSAFAETLKFLHNGGPIADSRLVSMSCSGGEAALVADMALEKKVSFPPFNAETKPQVAATLNEYVAIDNPLDYHTFIWNQPEKLKATFTEVLKGGFDVAMVILDTPTHPKMKPDAWATTARALVKASQATGARAAVVATLSEGMPLDLAVGTFRKRRCAHDGPRRRADGLRGRSLHRPQLGARGCSAGDAGAHREGRQRACAQRTRCKATPEAPRPQRSRGHRLQGCGCRRRG